MDTLGGKGLMSVILLPKVHDNIYLCALTLDWEPARRTTKLLTHELMPVLVQQLVLIDAIERT